MHRTRSFLLCLAVLTAVSITAASAAPDKTATLKPGETLPFAETSQAATNPLYFDQGSGTTPVPVGGDASCTKDQDSYCDTLLLTFENPVPQDATKPTLTKSATITVDPDQPGVDFDVLVYDVNPDGSRGAEVVASRAAAFPGTENTEISTISVVTSKTAPSKTYLIEVIYFTGVGGYAGTARF